jgi:hypothetical protein
VGPQEGLLPENRHRCRHRLLRFQEKAQTTRLAVESSPIQRTPAEQVRRQLGAGGANQSGLAQCTDVTRARVTKVLNRLKLHELSVIFRA